MSLLRFIVTHAENLSGAQQQGYERIRMEHSRMKRDTALAMQSFEKTIRLNPKNMDAVERLKQLKAKGER